MIGAPGAHADLQPLSHSMSESRLQEQETCRTLLSCVLSRSQMLSRNSKRLTTTKIPGVDDQALADVGFLLSSVSSKQGLMALFGLNHRTLGSCPVHNPGLPDFFDADTEVPDELGGKSQLNHNVERVLDLLEVASSPTRNTMISFDETCCWPTYATYADARGSFFIGGADSETRLETGKVHASELQKSRLAQTVVVYLLKRVDSNKVAYDILMRPRRLKSITASSNLEEAGLIWAAVTQEHGLPPLAQAHDNAPTQVVFSQLLLGLLPPHTYGDKTPLC